MPINSLELILVVSMAISCGNRLIRCSLLCFIGTVRGRPYSGKSDTHEQPAAPLGCILSQLHRIKILLGHNNEDADETITYASSDFKIARLHAKPNILVPAPLYVN